MRTKLLKWLWFVQAEKLNGHASEAVSFVHSPVQTLIERKKQTDHMGEK